MPRITEVDIKKIEAIIQELAGRRAWFLRELLDAYLDSRRDIIALRDALELAKNGLEWYRSEYPEQVNDSDGEADEQIEAALRINTHIPAPLPK